LDSRTAVVIEGLGLRRQPEWGGGGGCSQAHEERELLAVKIMTWG
jgi:hypothetical protein